jgi:hypothetical protein
MLTLYCNICLLNLGDGASELEYEEPPEHKRLYRHTKRSVMGSGSYQENEKLY